MKIQTQRPHEPHRRLTLTWKIGICFIGLVVLGIGTALYSLFWGLKPLPNPPDVRLHPNAEPLKMLNLLSDNGALFYLKAYDLLVPQSRGVENQIDVFLSGDEAARVDEVGKIVQDHAEALSMVRRGSQSALCQLPWLDREWTQLGDGSAMAAFRKLAKLLLCQGLLHEQNGEWEKALADYLVVIRFGRNCSHGAPQSGCQMGTEIRRMGIYFLRSLVWRAPFSRETLRSVSEEWTEITRNNSPFAETIRYELIDRKQFASRTLGDKPFHFPYCERDVHRMLEAAYGDAVFHLERPSWEAAMGDWERKWFVGPASYAAGAFDRMYSTHLLLLTMTSFRQPFDSVLSTLVHQDGAIVACALKRYQMERGELPDKLEKLVPDFLARVPIDPYDGNPLRYETKDGQWVLWSIGSDKIDNNAESRATDTDPRGDIVIDSQNFGPDFRRDFPKIRGEQ